MKTVLCCCAILLLLLFASSCSRTIKKPEWAYEKSAVRIHIKADNKLNLFNNKAHTLYVCLYQLRDVISFDKLATDASGIRQMLECRLFDEGVVWAGSKVIHPGEDIVLTLDRAERAEHIGLVAGYSAELSGERVVRRHKFQVRQKKEGYFEKVVRCEPCELNLEVAMGSGQIEYSRITPKAKMTCTDECE
jgi:type VI secretion system VasD/TssJ family lipoprotein